MDILPYCKSIYPLTATARRKPEAVPYLHTFDIVLSLPFFPAALPFSLSLSLSLSLPPPPLFLFLCQADPDRDGYGWAEQPMMGYYWAGVVFSIVLFLGMTVLQVLVSTNKSTVKDADGKINYAKVTSVYTVSSLPPVSISLILQFLLRLISSSACHCLLFLPSSPPSPPLPCRMVVNLTDLTALVLRSNSAVTIVIRRHRDHHRRRVPVTLA